MVAVPHIPLPLSSLPSLRGIEHIVVALPAQARAELKWTVPQIRRGLHEFLDGTRDHVALTRLARSLLEALLGLMQAAPAGWNDPLLDQLDGEVAAEVGAIRRSTDDVTADAVEWAMRTWLEASRVLPAFLRQHSFDDGAGAPAAVAGEQLDAVAEAEALPVRLEALLAAIIEAATDTKHLAAVPALADDAYDLAQRLRAVWRAQGLEIDPWRGESSGQRAARTKRYVVQLRGMLTEDDMRVIEESRLRTLR